MSFTAIDKFSFSNDSKSTKYKQNIYFVIRVSVLFCEQKFSESPQEITLNPV